MKILGKHSALVVALLSLGMVSCGGGGGGGGGSGGSGGSTPPVQNASPGGIWQGRNQVN